MQNLQHWTATEDYPYMPERIKVFILEPAISFHPGTAGSSLQQASAAANILFTAADEGFHFCNAEHLEAAMSEAVAMLTQDEQDLLKENVPGLIEEIDGIVRVYPFIAFIYHNAGVNSRIYQAMEVQLADEDWACLKASLEDWYLPPSDSPTDSDEDTNNVYFNPIYLYKSGELSFSITDANDFYDKILVWDMSADSYYDRDTGYWLWYNDNEFPGAWQYWIDGISSDYGDYGWMEHDDTGWYIEVSSGEWIELPDKYDTSELWYLEESSKVL